MLFGAGGFSCKKSRMDLLFTGGNPSGRKRMILVVFPSMLSAVLGGQDARPLLKGFGKFPLGFVSHLLGNLSNAVFRFQQ